MAHLLTKELKESVLQTAIEGKLSNKNCTDTPVQSTLKKIKELQDSLFKNKIEKPTKPTREVNDIELFEIPEHWQWVELSQIGTMTRGSGIKKTEVTQTGFPCVRYGQLYTTFKEKFDKAVSFVPEDIFNSCKKAHQGDILMSLTGENNFDIALAVVYEGLEEIAIGGDMMKLSNHCMNPYYLSFVLNSEYGINWKRKMAKGNIIVHISNDKLANIMIPTPPIEEQARIVAKVDEIMAKIDEYEKLENQLVKLKEQFPQDMKESLLQAGMMGKLTEQLESDTIVDETSSFNTLNEQRFDIPKVWTWFNLKDLMSICTGKKDQNFATRDGAYNFYTCAKEVFKAPNYSFEGESLILPGNGANVGTVTLYNGKFEAYQRTYVLQSINKTINMKFMYYCLLENWNRYNKNKMFGSAIPYIKLGNLQNYPVALPPIEEQQRIVDKLDELLPLVEHLSSMN